MALELPSTRLYKTRVAITCALPTTTVGQVRPSTLSVDNLDTDPQNLAPDHALQSGYQPKCRASCPGRKRVVRRSYTVWPRRQSVVPSSSDGARVCREAACGTQPNRAVFAPNRCTSVARRTLQNDQSPMIQPQLS